jgi:glycine cleavage system H protein
MNFPTNLRYTKEHEWVLLQGEIATVGITEFAQSELGDIVFVEIETLNNELENGAVFGSIEAVKTVSDLYMPLSGEITEKNTELDAQPELVNTEPYEKGWMVKIKITDASEYENLMDSHAYAAFVGV